MEYTIDAKDKKLGRIATEAAVLLMGKNTPDFKRNEVADVKVNIINASKLSIDDKKLSEKDYIWYTGHPGGLRKRTLAELMEKKGYGEVVKKAVYGMLPLNKLRSKVIKNLIVTE